MLARRWSWRAWMGALAACSCAACGLQKSEVTPSTLVNVAPSCALPSQFDVTCQGPVTNVRLDASASSDPNGDDLDFAWSTDCVGGVFDDPHSPTPRLTLPTPSCTLACNVMLTLDDGGLQASCSTPISITPPNLPPVCVLATQTDVMCQGVQASLVLDGSGSYDPEGASLSFAWTTDCAYGVFDDPHAATPRFSLLTPSCDFTCSATLTVDDGTQHSVCTTHIVVAPPALNAPGGSSEDVHPTFKPRSGQPDQARALPASGSLSPSHPASATTPRANYTLAVANVAP